MKRSTPPFRFVAGVSLLAIGLRNSQTLANGARLTVGAISLTSGATKGFWCVAIWLAIGFVVAGA